MDLRLNLFASWVPTPYAYNTHRATSAEDLLDFHLPQGRSPDCRHCHQQLPQKAARCGGGGGGRSGRSREALTVLLHHGRLASFAFHSPAQLHQSWPRDQAKTPPA